MVSKCLLIVMIGGVMIPLRIQDGNIGGQEFLDVEPDVTSDQSGRIDSIAGGNVDDVRNMKARDAAKMAGDSSGTIEGKVAGRVVSAAIPDDRIVEDAAKIVSKHGIWGLALAINRAILN